MQRAYEGAKTGRRTDGWVTAGSGANAEIAPALVQACASDRAIWCATILMPPRRCMRWSAIWWGRGSFRGRERSEVRLRRRQISCGWSLRANCDADGLTDFGGLQALVVRTMAESGEVLIRLRDRRMEDGLPVPLQLQVLEPDHLDSLKSGELPDGGFIVQGIEFDALGRRRAYWLFPTHPGDSRGRSLVSKPVPAAQVLHLYERLRPGQVRGVPWFAPVILKLRDLDDYDDAELMRKKIEACFAAFVTGAQDEDTLGKANINAAGDRIEAFEPGMIEYLEPGKDVKFATPSANGGYAEYMRLQLHAVAAGVGLTYELLTGDLSQVNYSSIRAGLIEFRRRMEALQWQVIVPGLCQPVWSRFVTLGASRGQIAGRSDHGGMDSAAL